MNLEIKKTGNHFMIWNNEQGIFISHMFRNLSACQSKLQSLQPQQQPFSGGNFPGQAIKLN